MRPSKTVILFKLKSVKKFLAKIRLNKFLLDDMDGVFIFEEICSLLLQVIHELIFEYLNFFCCRKKKFQESIRNNRKLTNEVEIKIHPIDLCRRFLLT
jgi:hypothetical protein